MEKIKVYNSVQTLLKQDYNNILKEISEIKPQTTFTKEQEEEFLKDAIVIFDYLKSGIDIKSSEIIINNGEIPFSCLEKLLIKFSEKPCKKERETYTLNVYMSDKGKPVKIYEFLNNEKKEHVENIEICLESKAMYLKNNLLFIESCPSTKRDSFTKLQLKEIVDFALKNDLILLYDITSSKASENVKSIYEVENAKKVAIEFKRFSSVDKDNINCGYLVIPECLKIQKDSSKNIYNRIKDLLQEEMPKRKVSRKSLKKLFLNYAWL